MAISCVFATSKFSFPASEEPNESQQPNIGHRAALLNVGEFSKGLYAIESTRDKINWSEKHDLTGFVAVANSNWLHDWQELSCSKLLQEINKGPAALRKQKLILSTYNSAGVINPQVKDWTGLCATN